LERLNHQSGDSM